ncbi:hypothetical protein GCM10009610_00200 [Pseudonocardia xinjiangensis]
MKAAVMLWVPTVLNVVVSEACELVTGTVSRMSPPSKKVTPRPPGSGNPGQLITAVKTTGSPTTPAAGDAVRVVVEFTACAQAVGENTNNPASGITASASERWPNL